MIVLADSGSTKTDWCRVEQGKITEPVRTNGINPFFQSAEEIEKEVRDNLLPQWGVFVPDTVYFYGAGCAFPEVNDRVAQAIGRCLPAPVEVGSDLLGAARALCGREAGIACILGTGSNSCFYDGKEIACRIPPLGFILGDEGGGAYLGKQLVADCLKKQLPAAVCRIFSEESGLTQAEILDRVYKQPFPNRFLAGLSPFLARHLDIPEIYSLVKKAFRAFFIRNVMHYDYRSYPVHFVGSIACCYQAILQEAAGELGVTVGIVRKSPLEGLAAYHSGTGL